MKKSFWTKTPVILLMTFLCCFLWGSAFPCVKIGYRLFAIASEDMASQLLFAGVRFTLAGTLVILFGSIRSRHLLLPAGNASPDENAPDDPGKNITTENNAPHTSGKITAAEYNAPHTSGRIMAAEYNAPRTSGRITAPERPISGNSIRMIIILSLFQTIGQYFFFYIGLAHASGVKASIIEASATFFAILVAALLFRTEKLNAVKLIGCLVGFAGVLIIQIPGSALDFHMAFNGEGFVLISTLMYAVSSSVIKQYAKREDTVVLSGYQFIFGGLVLAAAGALMGGSLTGFTPVSTLLLLYMALISAAAYTLWSLMLKYNPISKIAMFGFMNPVLGVLLSALLLGEHNQAFSIYGILSLLFVSAGIIIVYRLGERRGAEMTE